MARPRSKVTKVTVSARVSPEVKSRIQECADEKSLDVSVYLSDIWADLANSNSKRRRPAKHRTKLEPAVVLDPELRCELANIGNNICQIARAINGRFPAESMAAPIDFLGKMIEAQRDLHRLVELLSMPKAVRNDH